MHLLTLKIELKKFREKYKYYYVITRAFMKNTYDFKIDYITLIYTRYSMNSSSSLVYRKKTMVILVYTQKGLYEKYSTLRQVLATIC